MEEIGNNEKTEKIRAFWDKQREKAKECRIISRKEQDFKSDTADYELITAEVPDGETIKMRYICPRGNEKVPTVLMFHEYGRGARGWHHMTRFIALGYAVLALENRSLIFDITAGAEGGSPEELYAVKLFSDAIVCAEIALKLERTNEKNLIAWGEGLGGGLAIAVSAMLPCKRCAALNPMPCGFREIAELSSCEGIYSGIKAYLRNVEPERVKEERLFSLLDYVDCENFAPLLNGKFLMGTSMMDTAAPPMVQDRLFKAAGGEKRQIKYPKYAHERINFFENELIGFFA